MTNTILTDAINIIQKSQSSAVMAYINAQMRGESSFQYPAVEQAEKVVSEIVAALVQRAGVEEVAWQSRNYLGGNWSEWKECAAPENPDELEVVLGGRVAYQFRPLYPSKTIAQLQARIEALSAEVERHECFRKVAVELANVSVREALEYQRRITELRAQLEAQGEAVRYEGRWLDMSDASEGWSEWRNVDSIDLPRWKGRVAKHPNGFELRPLYTHPAPAAPVVGERYLLNGVRFKLSFNNVGGVNAMRGYRKELEGRWVALVAAENDCHLHPTQPKGEKAC